VNEVQLFTLLKEQDMHLQNHLERGAVGLPIALIYTVSLIQASPIFLITGVSLSVLIFVAAIFITYAAMIYQSTTSAGLGRIYNIANIISADLLVTAFVATSNAVLSAVMKTVTFKSFHNILRHSGTKWRVETKFTTCWE
jgi:hypothetical protein